MEGLAEQELKEINYRLYMFKKAHLSCSVFIGYSLVITIASVLLIPIYWLLGDGPIAGGVIIGLVFIVGGLAFAMWFRLREKHHFTQIRNHCLKLQRAGFYLFVILSGRVIGATNEMPSDERPLLDFEHLTADQLYREVE